ncbi:MAG TPA: hypothetical protein VEY09_08515 [Pyrinomonadaceae bacterium]|nr:hypothetical protein [Pyrinomonadaceae bacterium]
MNGSRKRFRAARAAALLLAAALAAGGCRRATEDDLSSLPHALKGVPAARLAFRLEPDVSDELLSIIVKQEEAAAEPLPGIKTDFETRRGNTEALIRTVRDPTGQRALAVYGTSETVTDFRIDLYAADGTFIRNLLPPDLTGVFPTEVAWSPDGQHIVFIGIRNPALPPQGQAAPAPPTTTAPPDPGSAPVPEPTTAPLIPSVPVFSTEQVYVGDRDGFNLRPLTTREGLIYFKLAWAPDGRSFAALAARESEWESRRAAALLPAGRPRLITLEGQERLLDDRLTPVAPVWSPDGSKVATAFDYDLAVYDAAGSAPTGGSLPLGDQLRAASARYDARVFAREANANGQAGGPAAPGANAQQGQSPDANAGQTPAPGTDPNSAEAVLISHNPIVRLEWIEPEKLYAQTAFVRFYRDEPLPTFKYARWHLVYLHPQAVVIKS